MVSAEEIQGALATRRMGRPTHVHDSLDSTQDEARRLALTGSPEGTVVWAISQASGRGRMGRSWQAGEWGLWFSVVLRPPVPAEETAFISLVAGVAAAETLSRLSSTAVTLKWPNDLRRQGLKLGGILVEAASLGNRVEHVVVGLGLNLEPPEAGFGDLAGIAGSVWMRGTAPAHLEVLAACLKGIEEAYDEWTSNGPASIRQRWLPLSDTIGREVAAELDGGVVKGRAVDLTERGHLVIETGEGSLQEVAAGEVTHLR